MATRYWVGGSGTWTANATSLWSATSGGAGGASVPGPADDVIINSLSGGPGIACGLGYSPTVNSVTISQDYLQLNNLTLTCNSISLSGTAVRGINWGTSVIPNQPSSGNIIIPTGNSASLLWTTSFDANINHLGTRRNVIFSYSGAVGNRQINIATGNVAILDNTFIDIFITGGSDNVQISATGSNIGVGRLDFTGFSGTLANAYPAAIRGNLVLSNTMTIPATANAVTFVTPAVNLQTITTAGKSLDFPITANALGNIRFEDNFTLGNNRTFSLLSGNLDFNDKTINVAIFNSSGSTNRRLVFGNTSTVNITGGNTGNTTIWNVSSVTNFSVTGNAVVNITGNLTSGNRIVTAGPFAEANAISFNLTAGSDNANIGGSFRDFSSAGFVGNLLATTGKIVYGNYVQGVGATQQTGSGILSFGATSGTKTVQTNNQPIPRPLTFFGAGGTWQLSNNINMSTVGSSTLTLSNGNLNLNNFTINAPLFVYGGTNPTYINFGNTGVLNVTSTTGTVWNATFADGFSYTGNAIVNFINTTGSPAARSILHGQLSPANSATKAPPMRISSGTLGLTVQGLFTSLDFTGFSGTLAGSQRILYGNMTMGANMTVTSSAFNTQFALANGTQTITTNGVATPMGIQANAPGGTFLFTSNMNLGTQTLDLNAGNLNTANFNLTAGTFKSTGNTARTLNLGTSTVTLSGTTAAWNVANSNVTINAANSSIELSTTTAANVQFIGGGYTYGNLTLSGNPAGNNLSTQISGNNTFVGAFTSTTKTGNYFVLFDVGSTNTFKSFAVAGAGANRVTIDSNAVGTHNLVYTGTGTVTVSRCVIMDSNASPANTWYAPPASFNTDGGNNTGWIFAAPVSLQNSNFFLVF